MVTLTRAEGSLPEDFHVTRRAAASMFFAGYALAAVAADAEPIRTPDTGLIVEEVLIPNGEAHPLPGYLARPRAPGRHPTILVANEVFGIHDYIKDICRRLAHLGYVALAPAYFYRSGVNLPAITDMKQIMAVVQATPEAATQGDTIAATAWLKHQPFVAPARIGMTGFCWGGGTTWRGAMTDGDLKAAVAWYGPLKPLIARAAEVKCPVLGLYGGQDQGITAEDRAAMDVALKAAGKRDVAIHVYPDAGHGFHADYRPSYNERDAKDGWARMLAFFRTHGVA